MSALSKLSRRFFLGSVAALPVAAAATGIPAASVGGAHRIGAAASIAGLEPAALVSSLSSFSYPGPREDRDLDLDVAAMKSWSPSFKAHQQKSREASR